MTDSSERTGKPFNRREFMTRGCDCSRGSGRLRRHQSNDVPFVQGERPQAAPLRIQSSLQGPALDCGTGATGWSSSG